MDTYEKFVYLVDVVGAVTLCEELYSWYGEDSMAYAIADIANAWDIDAINDEDFHLLGHGE